MDKGDFDGTINSNVDDYAEFLSAKADYGDKSKKDEDADSKPVPQSRAQVDRLSEAERAQLEVTPIDTNSPEDEPVVVPVQPKKEDDKEDAFGSEYLSVEQLSRARDYSTMTTKEKEHANAALSDNDDEPYDLDLAI